MTGVNLERLLLLLLVLLSGVLVNCTNRSWEDQVSDSPSGSVAPADCIVVFKDFMTYVGRSEPSIVNDSDAQNRFLTESMKKALANRLSQLRDDSDHHDIPANQTFTRVWNAPSSYTIAGSRHYDHRDHDNPNDIRSMIDVLYQWDSWSDGITNQYPGEKHLLSFIFVFEANSWKLDDVYIFDDEYTTTDSLKLDFQKDLSGG